jgi:cytochrome P450
MSAQIARLLVLYEDLRIELNAVEQETIAPLDDAGAEYRRLYFLRRTLVTFRDLHSSFQQLAKNADFRKLVLHEMSPEFKQVWKDAVKYFDENAETIRKARNAVGGHFSNRAARYVVKEMDDRIGSVEVTFHRSGTGGGATFKLAGELVAAAMSHAKDAGEDDILYFTRLVQAMAGAVGHVTKATHVLTMVHVIPRLH